MHKRIFRYLLQNKYFSVNLEYVKQYCMKTALKYKEKFRNILDKFEERGILNSEMLLVCSIIQELNIPLIIESGRFRGQSTEILAKFFRDKSTKIISIELRNDNKDYVEHKLRNYSNLKLLQGDSTNMIHKILSRNPLQEAAVLFDGPKGPKAQRIFKKLILNYPKLIVGFFHDVGVMVNNKQKSGRILIKNTYIRFFFTDDKDYVKCFQDLDEKCLAEDDNINIASWRPYIIGESKIGSYGPTLGVIFPLEKERVSQKFLLFHIYYIIESFLEKFIGENTFLRIKNKLGKAFFN